MCDSSLGHTLVPRIVFFQVSILQSCMILKGEARRGWRQSLRLPPGRQLPSLRHSVYEFMITDTGASNSLHIERQ